MARRPRKDRFTTTPSRVEVNVRAIPLLPPNGWRLYTLEELPLVGAVPKNYLAYGDPRSPETLGYVAKKGRMKADARECVTEEIISKIGAMLPVEMARSKLVRISKHDVRFLSQNFVVHIGAPDRHGMNWGVLAPLVNSAPVRFSPIYDTARGLFREYSDADLIKKSETARAGSVSLRIMPIVPGPFSVRGKRSRTTTFRW